MKRMQAIAAAAVAVAAMLVQAGAQPPAAAEGLSTSINKTKQIDPCAFANAAVLKAVLQTGMTANPPGYFPYDRQNGGEHFSISNPKVEQVTCPHMTLTVKADVQYRQTRGIPQFQAGGKATFESPLVANVVFSAPIGPARGPATPVTASNLVSATLVLTDINITSLSLDNVPGWLDPSWIRDCLNGQFSNWGCTDLAHQMSFDVTPMVRIFLSSTTL